MDCAGTCSITIAFVLTVFIALVSIYLLALLFRCHRGDVRELRWRERETERLRGCDEVFGSTVSAAHQSDVETK